MYEKVYRGVSRLAKEYFVLLCGTRNLHGTYDVLTEEPNSPYGNPATENFRIALSGRETYDVMQKVFEAENG